MMDMISVLRSRMEYIEHTRIYHTIVTLGGWYSVVVRLEIGVSRYGTCKDGVRGWVTQT